MASSSFFRASDSILESEDELELVAGSAGATTPEPLSTPVTNVSEEDVDVLEVLEMNLPGSPSQTPLPLL